MSKQTEHAFLDLGNNYNQFLKRWIPEAKFTLFWSRYIEVSEFYDLRNPSHIRQYFGI